MKNHIHKTKSYILSHKKMSAFILILVLLISYWIYKKATSTAGDIRYVVSKVERGTIIASVSGTGQVSALNQIEVKSKVSGDVVYIARNDGDKIWQGGLIAELNAKDAEKAVRDAQIDLDSAQIALDKLKLQKSSENLDADLAKSYDDGFNTVSNAFLDLPDIMTGLNNMFFKANMGPSSGQWDIDWYEGQTASEDHDKTVIYKKNFTDSYSLARKAYDASFDNYKSVSRTSDKDGIEKLINTTYNTTKIISDVIKNANNYIDFVNDSMERHNFDIPKIITTDKTSLSTYTSKTNTHLINLLSIKNSIKSFKDAFPNADLDIRSSILSLQQKQNSLQDAKDKLADYFIRAPFDGTIAKINIKKSDSISAGTSMATLITKKQLADISLNEVDVAKIKIGEKATLTFDAVPNLSISGVVEEIDSVGAISQGVVTYNVKISFDTQDERVKPSMSVSASIITDVKQDVLMILNSAIKSQNKGSYVEMFSTPLVKANDGLSGSISKVAPKKIPVEVGLSNDSNTEIISGVKEGDDIVTRTILPTATKTASAPSIFGSTGGGSRANSNAIRPPSGRSN